MPDLEISADLSINYTIHPPKTSPTVSQTTAKPWVILIDGLADPQATWSAQMPAFTGTGYTVLTYDIRGVGRSSRPRDDYHVYLAADMASDLRRLVDALRVPTPYHVLGVSMGGMIAQACGLMYLVGRPSDVLSVMFACTYAAPEPYCRRMFSLWADMAARMSVADVMRVVSLWCFTPAFLADPAKQDDLAAMEDTMGRIDAEMGLRAYLVRLNVIVQFDSRREIASLGQDARLNVIVLAGDRDILIPTSLSRELYELIPGAAWRTHRACWTRLHVGVSRRV